MNGITYYRLNKNLYPGDTTKNCALNGIEVDGNFYELEGRDVKSIEVKGKDIVLTLLNGKRLSAEGVLDFVKPINVEFDKLNGVLKLTNADGTIQKIEGFATNENTDFSVSTDNTLFGDGLRNAPLGVAPSYRTGQYKTVKSIVNVAEGGSLPTCGNIMGDRYLTAEDISDYGYLYDYKAVREIASELAKTGWRIPTKADWDDLLNAVEPCECDKNHEQSNKNTFLGRWAGKLLKSKTMWKNGCCSDSCGNCGCDEECGCDECSKKHDCGCVKKHDCGCEGDCDCGDNTCFDYSDDPCVSTGESEHDCKCEKKCDDHRGLDAFGFRVTPAGYADDGCNFGYFKERAAFWTATTNSDNTKAYIKRFHYNKDGVYQDVIGSNYHLSLRLVKDYDGKNYRDVEEIMDMEYPTLLLPSVSKGKTIWTSANFACGNASLSPMLPNNGQGITYTRHYFINEWNGFMWVRNEMKQGDVVTVAKAPKGKSMIEYRVVGNDLVSDNEMVYDDVIKEIEPKLDELEDKIKDEAVKREEADKALQEAIDNEKAAREEADNKLQENIDAEAKTREEADGKIHETMAFHINYFNEAIKTVNDNLVQAINTINGGIEAERQIRAEADTKLQENIDAEEAARIAADEEEAAAREATDNALREAINEEAAERAAEDSKLNTKIEKETAERQLMDELLQSNIDDEIKAREDADTELQANIDAEAEAREEADNEIKGKLLTQEGTVFDAENGVLTLKSADGTNDVTVQFAFNFGEF